MRGFFLDNHIGIQMYSIIWAPEPEAKKLTKL